VYRDRERQLVLVLEPDIVVHDLDAIEKEDSLVLTSRKYLREESIIMKEIGWSYTHEGAVRN
jgi:hypothetical protein